MPLSKNEIARYSRNIQLQEVGEKGQEKLKNAKVLVIGAGGLGCPVLQYLTAIGVGTLGIIDNDVVDVSNLQRQILFDTNSIGQNKAIAARDHLKNLNPHIQINVYTEKFQASNAIELAEKYDLLVDGSDNIPTRYLVNDACVLTNKPFVYGGIHRFEGQVAVFNYQNGPTYRCLFPNDTTQENTTSCEQIGVLGILPGLIGSYQATEAIKIILGIGAPLSGRLLMLDALSGSSTFVNIKRADKEVERLQQSRKSLKQENYQLSCISDEVIEITANDLKVLLEGKQTIHLVDVRDKNEQPSIPELKGAQLPVQKIAQWADQIDTATPTILYCQQGQRSANAIKYLQEKRGLSNLKSLKGGLSAWIKIHDKLKQ